MALLRYMLTLSRFGPHYVSRPRGFGKRGVFILEADEALGIILKKRFK